MKGTTKVFINRSSYICNGDGLKCKSSAKVWVVLEVSETGTLIYKRNVLELTMNLAVLLHVKLCYVGYGVWGMGAQREI